LGNGNILFFLRILIANPSDNADMSNEKESLIHKLLYML